MIKESIKSILVRLNLFYKVKYSRLFDWYLGISRPEVIRRRKEDKAFFSELLSDKMNLIFDIGANHGDKTAIFSRIARKVVAVDPDQTNNTILKTRFGGSNSVLIVNKAVDASAGTSSLFIVEDGSGLNTMSKKWVDVLEDQEKSRWDFAMNFEKRVEIQTTTLEDLILLYGKPDYIKIDVEGYEVNVIRGLKEPVTLISFECNLPEFYTETLECIDHLHALDSNALFNYHDEFIWGFERFVQYRQFLEWYKSSQKRYFEIFCRMNPGN